jgi:hypothetical protein
MPAAIEWPPHQQHVRAEIAQLPRRNQSGAWRGALLDMPHSVLRAPDTARGGKRGATWATLSLTCPASLVMHATRCRLDCVWTLTHCLAKHVPFASGSRRLQGCGAAKCGHALRFKTATSSLRCLNAWRCHSRHPQAVLKRAAGFCNMLAAWRRCMRSQGCKPRLPQVSCSQLQCI